MINYDLNKFFVSPLDSINTKHILFNFSGTTNTIQPKKNKKITLNPKPILFKDYKNKFDLVKFHLIEGDSYLLNLTFPTEIDTEASLEEIFYSSKALFKMKFFEDFVFFSPERFVLIEDGKIFTHPMKGTKLFQSESSISELLNDEKELAEHITIVDLMRNDLSMVAKDVSVTNFRYISLIKTENKTIIQTSSQIEGVLTEGSIAEKIIKLLPAGSISGAPKRKTLEIIKNAEIDSRGFYTGIAGIFDGERVDSCVIIRYIEKKGDKLFYRSGGGITVYSNAEDEYMEMINKIYVPCI